MTTNGNAAREELIPAWWAARFVLGALRGDSAARLQVLRECAAASGVGALVDRLADDCAGTAVALVGREQAEVDLVEAVGRMASALSALESGDAG
jgi:hypothetical protein